MKDARDDEERAIIEAFGQDDGSTRFIDRTAQREKQEYRERGQRAAYVRMCVKEASMETYLRHRFDLLARTVSLHRSDKAHDELDAQIDADRSKDSGSSPK